MYCRSTGKDEHCPLHQGESGASQGMLQSNEATLMALLMHFLYLNCNFSPLQIEATIGPSSKSEDPGNTVLFAKQCVLGGVLMLGCEGRDGGRKG